MNIDIMINNIILHNKLSCVYEKMQHCKSAKIQKKIKKSGEGGCLRMYWHRGGVGYTCNTLQRSFDSLYTALIKAI